MTHRLSTVSQPPFCIFGRSISVGRLFSPTYRRTNVAIPLSHHERCLLAHIHPVHRTGRNLRPLTSRSLLTRSPALIIDTPEPDPPAHDYIQHPLFISPPYWLRFRFTLLEATVIHLLVFIVYYGLYRTDDNGSVPNSVVDSFPRFPPFHSPTHPPTFTSFSFSFLNPLTTKSRYPPTPMSSTHSHPNPFPAPIPLPSLPFTFSQLYNFHTRLPSSLTCISDYALSHSHLIFITVISLLLSRIRGQSLGDPSRSRRLELCVV